MITIEDVLLPKHIVLDLEATTPAGAILEVAELLRGDERVSDWNTMYEGLRDGHSCIINEFGRGMCIPHARTKGVSAMAMAAGRSVEGIVFEDLSIRAHYIFVIGVPEALAADYLRIVGALARIVKSSGPEAALLAATTRNEFRDALIAGEVR